VVGAEPAQHFFFDPAVACRDFGPQGFGDLDAEGIDAPTRTSPNNVSFSNEWPGFTGRKWVPA
jgi:hypothetical protein